MLDVMERRFTILIMLWAGLMPIFVRCEATAEPACRDPFWPVGYQPPVVKKDVPPPIPVKVVPVSKPTVVVPPKPAADWTVARSMLKVSGFAESNDARSCFVNGRLVSEGETVALVHAGYRYMWRVDRIDREPENQQFEPLTVQPVDQGP